MKPYPVYRLDRRDDYSLHSTMRRCKAYAQRSCIWEHPELILVSPSLFEEIKREEKAGFIYSMGIGMGKYKKGEVYHKPPGRKSTCKKKSQFKKKAEPKKRKPISDAYQHREVSRVGKKITPERFKEIMDSAYRQYMFGDPSLPQDVLEDQVDDLAMHIMWVEDNIMDGDVDIRDLLIEPDVRKGL